MAVTKIWPVKDSLARVVDYTQNPAFRPLSAALSRSLPGLGGLGAIITLGRSFSCQVKKEVEDGEEHIFYSYPGAYGQSEKRASASIPDGAQSWCTLCRGDDYGPHYGGRRCSEVNFYVPAQ